jgi:hypothetical protein
MHQQKNRAAIGSPVRYLGVLSIVFGNVFASAIRWLSLSIPLL